MMNKIIYLLQKIGFTGTIACLLVGITTAFPGWTQLTQSQGNSHNGKIRFIQPTLPTQEAENMADRGAPNDTEPGGTRGDCPALLNSEPGLTALLPLASGIVKNNELKFAIGLTISEYPTFWIYFPYSPETISSVKFVLLDENNNYVVRDVKIPIPQTPGVISFSLPSQAKPLEVGQLYQWYLLVDCKPTSASDIVGQGVVKRIQLLPELAEQLKTATPRERIAIYAENGIWHETLNLLGELRRSTPQDTALTTDWITLLDTVGLKSISQKPISQCCTTGQ